MSPRYRLTHRGEQVMFALTWLLVIGLGTLGALLIAAWWGLGSG